MLINFFFMYSVSEVHSADFHTRHDQLASKLHGDFDFSHIKSVEEFNQAPPPLDEDIA
jgi:hypothetical protein